MKLEIGHIFEKNGITYCVLDILDYEGKKYILFSIEDDKLDYLFYEVEYANHEYILNLLTDELLINKLFEIVEGKNE